MHIDIGAILYSIDLIAPLSVNASDFTEATEAHPESPAVRGRVGVGVVEFEQRHIISITTVHLVGVELLMAAGFHTGISAQLCSSKAIAVFLGDSVRLVLSNVN